MITRQIVSEHLLQYLNGQMSLSELVDWAEDGVGLSDFVPDEDVDLLMEIMMYLAGGDTAYFPLTWDICQDFMRQLGTPIKAVVADQIA